MEKSGIQVIFNKGRSLIKNNTFFFSLILLVIALITYGIFIFSQGFYWDDWPPILLSHIPNKISVWQYFMYDRPFQSWTYYVLFPICKDSAFAWQFSAIFFRWTSALTLYFTFLAIFPKQKTLLQWSTILFMIFPGFADLNASVSYGSHFMAYTAFGLSLLTMVLAIKNKHRSKFLLPLSLFFTIVHLLTMEYFVGLELLRPVIIFILISQTETTTKKSLWKTLVYWLPWLVILTGYGYWRLVVYQAAVGNQFGTNFPSLFSRIIASPSNTLLALLNTIFLDLKFLFANLWVNRLLPDDLPVTRITFWLSLLIGFATIILVYFIHFKKDPDSKIHLTNNESWLLIGIGFYIVLIGMIPVWTSGHQITKGKWSDRFDLAAMFGVALFFITLFFTIIHQQKVRNVILICLVGLSIAYQIRIGNDYRKDFIRQITFYKELAWRIPKLEPGTAIFSPGTPSDKEAEYSYAAGINLLFENNVITGKLNYWFFTPRYYSAESLIDDPTQKIEQGLRIFNFTGSGDKIVSIHMPVTGCLWVINPYYATYYSADKSFPLYAQISNDNLISDQASNQKSKISQIVNTGPENSWCYYFEKGDLAQSKGDWQEAITDYEAAKKANMTPVEGIEYLPFIMAYANNQQISEALALTQKSFDKAYTTKPTLCKYWHDMTLKISTISLTDIQSIYNAKNCPAYFQKNQ